MLRYSHVRLNNTCGVQEFVNSRLVCTSLCGDLASAQAHTLLLAHVSTHKEGFELPFSFDIDKAPTLTRVPQLRQHGRRFLRNLGVHTQN